MNQAHTAPFFPLLSSCHRRRGDRWSRNEDCPTRSVAWKGSERGASTFRCDEQLWGRGSFLGGLVVREDVSGTVTGLDGHGCLDSVGEAEATARLDLGEIEDDSFARDFELGQSRAVFEILLQVFAHHQEPSGQAERDEHHVLVVLRVVDHVERGYGGLVDGQVGFVIADRHRQGACSRVPVPQHIVFRHQVERRLSSPHEAQAYLVRARASREVMFTVYMTSILLFLDQVEGSERGGHRGGR